MRRSIILFLAFGLLLAACSLQGSDPRVPTTTPAVETTVASNSTPSLATTTTREVTTSLANITTTKAEEYDVVLEGGDEEVSEIVVHGPDVFEQTVGDEVAITVLSSVEDEIHVHGYDIRFDAAPSEVTVVAFTADVLGIFEVELENSHVRLFLIEVTP
jgi:hypothetical protein